MRRWISSAIFLTLVACGGKENPPPSEDPSNVSDAASDAMTGRDSDAMTDRDSARCPMPVDCTQPGSCDLPPLAPAMCIPIITEANTWTECSNGYVIISLVIEGHGGVTFYRDGKLEARLWGNACLQGPPDYVDPPCRDPRFYDLCHLSDAGIDAQPRDR